MSRGFGLRLAAALFLAGPAAIHFAVVPEHLNRYALYGVFFVVLGLLQLGLAVVILLRPSSGALFGGAILSLLVIALWLVSRTIGLPIAPVPWRPEAVGLPDLLSTLMEWISVWLLIVAESRLDSRRGFRAARAAPALSLAAAASAALTLAGLSAVGTGVH